MWYPVGHWRRDSASPPLGFLVIFVQLQQLIVFRNGLLVMCDELLMASSIKIHLCFSSKCACDVTSGCYIFGKTSRARDRRRFKTVSVASKTCVNKKKYLLHCNDVGLKHLIHTNRLMPSLTQFIQMYNCRITLRIFRIKRFCCYLSRFVLRKYVDTWFFVRTCFGESVV